MRARSVSSIALLLLSACGGDSNGNDTDAGDPGGQLACAQAPGTPQTIAAAKLYIEHNFTDEDTGVHGAFDDHGWSELCVYDPSGAQILSVKPQGSLGDLTLAGIFFESREPPNTEFSIADLEAAFPEGMYQVRGTNFDGTGLTGMAIFTHDVPAAPTITFPAEDAVVPVTGLVVTWDPVTTTLDGDPLTITGYEVIVTKEAAEDPNGFSQPIFDVHLPPSRSSLTISDEFLEPATQYELEVLALETSGNQTISVSFFTTE